MSVDRLKIFISGKQGELDNERAIIRELVLDLGFEPVSSEDRPASDTPIEEKYRKELFDSDIYVGVFGVCESDASIDEFWKALEYTKQRLVFLKEIKVSRQPKMQEFVDDIKSGKIKINYKNFKFVTDLREKVHDAVVDTITTGYRKRTKGEI